MDLKGGGRPQSLSGVLFAGPAYLMWGFSPIYFKAIQHVPAFEILMHRIIWSQILLLVLLIVLRRWGRFVAALRNRDTLLVLLSTTILVSFNWFLFIWAINTGRILQTSLGYYINPMVNVLLGMVFLRERLRPLQGAAVGLAAAAVLYLTIGYGGFPWISLSLAFSFAFYGLIRKVCPVEAMEGLAVETMLLSVPALAYLVYLDRTGSGSVFHCGIATDLLLMGTAWITAPPLLLFTMGARRLHLTTLGFLQYIAPSCSFLLAVFVYQEPFQRAQLVTFSMIWTALAIFTTDAALRYRRTGGMGYSRQAKDDGNKSVRNSQLTIHN